LRWPERLETSSLKSFCWKSAARDLSEKFCKCQYFISLLLWGRNGAVFWRLGEPMRSDVFLWSDILLHWWMYLEEALNVPQGPRPVKPIKDCKMRHIVCGINPGEKSISCSTCNRFGYLLHTGEERNLILWLDYDYINTAASKALKLIFKVLMDSWNCHNQWLCILNCLTLSQQMCRKKNWKLPLRNIFCTLQGPAIFELIHRS